MFLKTTWEIWEAICQTYSKMRDVALIYEIKTKISSTKQGTCSVIEYYNLVKSFWLELGYYHNVKTNCNKDVGMLQRESIFWIFGKA